MCDTIYLLNQAEVETIHELELAFGLAVDDFHLFPHLLHPGLIEESTLARTACLCYIDLVAYLDAAWVTWYYAQSGPGDINVLMMPARHLQLANVWVPTCG